MKQRCCIAANFGGLNFGETGWFWSDSSTPIGCVWFFADSSKKAIAVPHHFIFT